VVSGSYKRQAEKDLKGHSWEESSAWPLFAWLQGIFPLVLGQDIVAVDESPVGQAEKGWHYSVTAERKVSSTVFLCTLQSSLSFD
jgi:hypothetical protein